MANRVQPSIRLRPAFLYSFAVGFALWALSPLWLGVPEPWDTDGHVYKTVLLCAGALLGVVSTRSIVSGYLGIWFGQVAAMIVLPSYPNVWLLLGVVTTAIGSIVFVLGAAATIGLRLLVRSRRAA